MDGRVCRFCDGGRVVDVDPETFCVNVYTCSTCHGSGLEPDPEERIYIPETKCDHLLDRRRVEELKEKLAHVALMAFEKSRLKHKK